MGDRLMLVGGGKMGGALLAGWLETGTSPADVVVVEPAPEAATALARQGVTVVAGRAAVPEGFFPQTVVLAVKPQVMPDIVPVYVEFAGPSTVFLSVAAGRPIQLLQGWLGEDAAIVRAMPNTPAAVRRGMTVACASPRVAAVQKARCENLLRAVGDVAWVDDEALMDAVTAVSGSGPAYVFLLAETLAEAGVAAGLPADLALRLARVTVAGAGELLHRSDLSAATLRNNVTSPGGTTAAALGVLMGPDGWADIVTRAVAAAARRSRELAG